MEETISKKRINYKRVLFLLFIITISTLVYYGISLDYLNNENLCQGDSTSWACEEDNDLTFDNWYEDKSTFGDGEKLVDTIIDNDKLAEEEG